MARLYPGRYTAEAGDGFVVFMIGWRVNRPWKLRNWYWMSRQMRPMLEWLKNHPEEGLLGVQYALIGSSPAAIQYWRSFEDLLRFSRNLSAPHLEAWRRYNKVIAPPGDIGVWHEVYRVRAGDYEAIYTNMPLWGLAAATRQVPVNAGTESAEQRIGDAREASVASRR